jgi:hypothetical protein
MPMDGDEGVSVGLIRRAGGGGAGKAQPARKRYHASPRRHTRRVPVPVCLGAALQSPNPIAAGQRVWWEGLGLSVYNSMVRL